MIEVYKIAHAFCQVAPFGSKLHDILTAFAIVVFRGYIVLRLRIINIGLSDAEFFLYS